MPRMLANQDTPETILLVESEERTTHAVVPDAESTEDSLKAWFDTLRDCPPLRHVLGWFEPTEPPASQSGN